MERKQKFIVSSFPRVLQCGEGENPSPPLVSPDIFRPKHVGQASKAGDPLESERRVIQPTWVALPQMWKVLLVNCARHRWNFVMDAEMERSSLQRHSVFGKC